MTTHLPTLHTLASRSLVLLLASLLALSSPAQDSTTPAPTPAPTEAAEPAEPSDSNLPPSDEEESPEDPASTNAPPASTSTNSVASTNSPASRPSRRSSRRTPERSGLRDWRSSSRNSSSKDPSTNGPSKTDYAYFQLVNDRNIFNPSRVPNRPDRPRNTEQRRQPKIESLSLVGTLRYEKGPLAFFDGTSSDFKKALKPGDSIAGHRILSVTDSTVRLVVNESPIDLKVGTQLRREDEGDWKLAEGVTLGSSSPSSSSSSSSASSNTASTSSSSTSTPSSAASSGSSGGGAEEILRRLRERRAQENKQ